MRQRQLYMLCAGLLLLATSVSGDENSTTQGHTGDSASASDPWPGHADATVCAPSSVQ